MMETHKKLFFEILQCGLWGKPVEMKATKEGIRDVVKIAHAQAVLAIVADVIISNDEWDDCLTDGETKALRRFVLSNLSTSRSWNIAVQKIISELRSNNIEPVLLKGQGIAQYYPNPDLRQCGDIDLYVPLRDFERTCEVMLEMASEEEKTKAFLLKKHFQVKVGKVPIEIHRFTDIYYPKKLDRIYQQFSDEGVTVDVVPVSLFDIKVSTPSVTFNVFYVFSHFWHHFVSEGVGLRQICDWTVLIHHSYGKIDTERLRDMLNRLGLMKIWATFGCIAVDFLGLQEEKFPFYDNAYRELSKKVLTLIMLEGNFGFSNFTDYKRPNGYIKGKLYAFRHYLIRNLRVLRIFPADACLYLVRKSVNGVRAVLKDIFHFRKK